MVASAANGFMNTQLLQLQRHAVQLPAAVSTPPGRRTRSNGPWLISGILNQFEIGHFEPCSKVTGKLTIGLGPGVSDTTWLTCHGAYEAAGPPDAHPGRPGAH